MSNIPILPSIRSMIPGSCICIAEIVSASRLAECCWINLCDSGRANSGATRPLYLVNPHPQALSLRAALKFQAP